MNHDLDWKLGDIIDSKKMLKNNPKKEKPSSSSNTSSQSLFKVEEKMIINPYQGEIDVIKFNTWFKNIEVYLMSIISKMIKRYKFPN